MGVYDIIKDGAKVARNAGQIELSIELVRVADELLAKQKRIGELEQREKELEQKLELKGKLVTKNEVYWLKEKDRVDGPFCTRCWDVDKNLVRLSTDYIFCPHCKSRMIGAEEPFEQGS